MADGSTSAPADRTQRAREALKDAQDWTSKTFDSSLTSASQTIKEGSAQASQAYGAAFRRGEVRPVRQQLSSAQALLFAKPVFVRGITGLPDLFKIPLMYLLLTTLTAVSWGAADVPRYRACPCKGNRTVPLRQIER